MGKKKKSYIIFQFAIISVCIAVFYLKQVSGWESIIFPGLFDVYIFTNVGYLIKGYSDYLDSE